MGIGRITNAGSTFHNRSIHRSIVYIHHRKRKANPQIAKPWQPYKGWCHYPPSHVGYLAFIGRSNPLLYSPDAHTSVFSPPKLVPFSSVLSLDMLSCTELIASANVAWFSVVWSVFFLSRRFLSSVNKKSLVLWFHVKITFVVQQCSAFHDNEEGWEFSYIRLVIGFMPSKTSFQSDGCINSVLDYKCDLDMDYNL